MSWELLNTLFCNETQQTIKDMGFYKPTEVQQQCIPHFLQNKDVAVEAVTGSGKTLAFLIPCFEIMKRRSVCWKKLEIGALIISPTAELAQQTYDTVRQFLTHYTQFTAFLVNRGSSCTELINAIMTNGCNIMVATPGRLSSILQQQQSNGNNLMRAALKSLEILVLDEADRLLNKGFENDLNSILSMLPKQRRTGLFSATQTNDVMDFIRAGMRQPVRLAVLDKSTATFDTRGRLSAGGNKCGKLENEEAEIMQKTPASLQNYYTVVPSHEKLSYLLHFLKHHSHEKIIIFLSTCACVDYFYKILQRLIITPDQNTKNKKSSLKPVPLLSSCNNKVLAIHGKMQTKRGQIFTKFRDITDGGVVLLCTDLMARGVDIPAVHWVIQYDCPTNASSFVHRCGRTARCGMSGKALLILRPHEECYVKFLRLNQKVALQPFDWSLNKELTFSTNEDTTKMAGLQSVQSGTSTVDLDIDGKLVFETIRHLALQDRLLFEKSVRAFVSFVRFYKKHECHLIFEFNDLDLYALAHEYCLLKLPKMPELKQLLHRVNSNNSNISINNVNLRLQNNQFVFENYPELNISNIPYHDKSVRVQRKKMNKERLVKQLLKAQLEPDDDSNIKTNNSKQQHVKSVDDFTVHKVSYSNHKRKAWCDIREKRERKQLKKRKRNLGKIEKEIEKVKNLVTSRNDDDNDEDDLAEDYRLVKKLKRRKIGQSEFDDKFLFCNFFDKHDNDIAK